MLENPTISVLAVDAGIAYLSRCTCCFIAFTVACVQTTDRRRFTMFLRL